jgi:hypothetical protein
MTTLQSADKSALDKLISSLRTPVFLAGLDEKPRRCLTLHTARSGAGRNLRREAKQALARSGIGVRCKVKEHSARRLEKDSSLDRLVRRFRHDSIIFDPTGGVGRSQAVVRCAANIRGALGDGVAGIYLEPWRRALYVVLHRDFVVRDGKVAPDRLREIETSVAAAVGDGLDGIAGSMALAVRVGLALPNTPVVPVDAASARAGRGAHPQLLSKLRSGSIAATVAAFFGVGVAASAMAEGPAVSGPNARVSAGVGATDGDATGLVFGSATVPVDDKYGAQVDGLLGGIDGDAAWGIQGHLFWRDPDTGLLGLKGSVRGRDSDTLSRIGVEGELYSGQFTWLGGGGYQFGDDVDSAYGLLQLHWYATDDFMVGGGGEVADSDFVATFETEYQPGLAAFPGLTVYADAEIGTGDWSRIFVGLRIYFGGEVKSLVRRHREDDPWVKWGTGWQWVGAS